MPAFVCSYIIVNSHAISREATCFRSYPRESLASPSLNRYVLVIINKHVFASDKIRFARQKGNRVLFKSIKCFALLDSALELPRTVNQQTSAHEHATHLIKLLKCDSSFVDRMRAKYGPNISAREIDAVIEVY